MVSVPGSEQARHWEMTLGLLLLTLGKMKKLGEGLGVRVGVGEAVATLVVSDV